MAIVKPQALLIQILCQKKPPGPITTQVVEKPVFMAKTRYGLRFGNPQPALRNTVIIASTLGEKNANYVWDLYLWCDYEISLHIDPITKYRHDPQPSPSPSSDFRFLIPSFSNRLRKVVGFIWSREAAPCWPWITPEVYSNTRSK